MVLKQFKSMKLRDAFDKVSLGIISEAFAPP